jgi:hypothetical protein
MRPSAEIDAVHGRIEGCSQPLEEVTAELRDEGGAVRAGAQATAEADGRYDLALQDADGRLVQVKPTDSIQLCARADCALLPMRWTWVALDGEAISGQAKPSTQAFLTIVPSFPFAGMSDYPQLEGWLKPRWYPLVKITVPDATGNVRLTDEDIESWAVPWRLGDIETVRLSSEIEVGRYAVADARRGKAVYLPHLMVPGPTR